MIQESEAPQLDELGKGGELAPAAAKAFELLARNPAFATIKPAFLSGLVERGNVWRYVRGQTLTRQGGPADKLFVILAGEVRVEHRTADGALVQVAELGPGEPVGEMAIIANESRINTVKALTDLEVLEIDADHVKAVFARDQQVLEGFVALVSNRLWGSSPRHWV